MNDNSPEMQRVSFEVAREDIAELMQLIGGFVASHDIRLTFGDLPAPREKPEYDPKLVTWITDPETGEEVAIITRTHLLDFNLQHYPSSGTGERAGNCLLYAARYKMQILDYVVMPADPNERSAYGLRVDRFKLLVNQLRSKAIKVEGLGNGTIRLLEAYERALFPEETSRLSN